MIKTTITCSFIAIAASLSAQDQPTKSPETAENFKKNEISINTAPLFRLLLASGNDDAIRYSATYKRNLNEHSALRISLMADKLHPNNYYAHPWKDAVIIETDSALYKQINFEPSYLRPHLNLGYEQSFGKHKLKWFYGSDLVFGYSQSRSAVENILLQKDTVQGQVIWTEAEGHSWEVVSKTNVKTVSVGISPFFGAKFPISKRFMISAQVGFDMTMSRQEITVTKGGIRNKSNVSNFDFSSQTGILNDISLVYRF